MSLTGILFNLSASHNDKKRDSAIALPRGISEHRNISYGPYGDASLMDIYYPKGTQGKLPTIVSIHGGGYVYGSKEIYRRYGMDMARRGFVFVNFNYRFCLSNGIHVKCTLCIIVLLCSFQNGSHRYYWHNSYPP